MRIELRKDQLTKTIHIIGFKDDKSIGEEMGVITYAEIIDNLYQDKLKKTVSDFKEKCKKNNG